ncbi:ion transporter [Salinisphaera hydrothermalis]|uniref:ion transporter n=1 Tax=Salinisphaera hydrothermalis TaxID=563188 RepID=UPI0033420A8D
MIAHSTDTGLRLWLRTVIFGTDTPAGRGFDIVLLVLIVASVINLMLVSVAAIEAQSGALLQALEWLFTLAFSLEYAARIYAARRRWAYIFSFYGLVDLVSILPLYIGLLLPEAQYLVAVRTLRMMRIFRVLKLVRYANDAGVMTRALRHAQRKMQIFLGMLALMVTILGALMYVVEGPAHGFTSIPRSIYWAIVTITTVGYGDISPSTPLGQAIAGVAILGGYAILAVTGGIITAELTNEISAQRRKTLCPHCERSGHEIDADYCKFCGGDLSHEPEDDAPVDEEQASARDKLD